MPIDFPSSPSLNQTYTYSGKTWTWNGSAWQLTNSTVTSVIGVSNGGTGITAYILGDLLYSSESNTLSKLSGNTTTTKKFLSQTGTGTVSAAPVWVSLTSSDVTTALGFTPSSPGGSSGQFQYKNASGEFSGTSALQYQATAFEDIRVYGTSSSRVPFSVDAPPSMTVNIFEITSQQTTPYITIDNLGAFSVLQNDIIGCGNLIFKNSVNNRTITLARPSTFAASFTLTLPTSAGSSNQHLMTNGAGTLFWGSYIASLSGGNSTTLLGSIPYQSDVNTTTLLSPNTTTTRKFLRQTGTGTNGAAPAWDTLTSPDITTALGYTPSSTTIPSGSLQMYAGPVTQSASGGVVTTNAPSGWLLCNGDIISRSTYSALFSAIGTTYGSGDGSTTFALPDMRGRMPMGVGTGAGLTARTLGGTVGQENSSLLEANLPAHAHSFTPSGSLTSESSHTHTSANAGNHNHTGVNGWQPLVFTSTGGGANVSAGTSFQRYNFETAMNYAGDHGHGSTNSNSGHTHTFNGSPGTTGNGNGTASSFTNMPPAIGLNFIIKT